MRDRLVHDYDHVDLDILEDVVEHEFPNLISTLDRLLEARSNQGR